MYNDQPSFGGAPPYSMPAVTPGQDYVGLGFWGALIPIATSVVGGLVGGGDGSTMSANEYYPAAYAGQQLCAGPYNVQAMAAAIGNLGSDAEGSRLKQEIRSTLMLDAKAWGPGGLYPNPSTPTQQAGALVNWANGGRNCPEMGGNDFQARRTAAAIMAHEATRQRTLAERARQAAAAAAAKAQTVAGGAPIVAGVSNTALLGGAALVAFLLLRK